MQATSGMRNKADCGEGFTRIANQLLDALAAANLTKHQFKVALAVIRKIDGFNQSFDWVSNGQLSTLTGLPQTRVSTAKNQLLEMGVLVRQGRKIGINKVLSEWKCKFPHSWEEPPETGIESFPGLGNPASPKQGTTKDTIQKTITENTSEVSADANSTQVMLEKVIVPHPLLSPISQPIQPAPPTTERPHSVVAGTTEEFIPIELLLNTGATYQVTAEFSAQMQMLYPRVDVVQELRAMCGWLLVNPTKRKTKAGILRFINSWLSRCQDRSRGSSANRPVPRGEEWDLTKTMNAEKLNVLLEELF